MTQPNTKQPMLAYVASPFRAEHPAILEENLRFARGCSRFLALKGFIPIAPHLLLPQFLSDDTERELAFSLNEALLKRADCIWFFLDLGMSAGMERELEFSTKIGLPIWQTLLKGAKNND